MVDKEITNAELRAENAYLRGVIDTMKSQNEWRSSQGGGHIIPSFSWEGDPHDKTQNTDENTTT